MTDWNRLTGGASAAFGPAGFETGIRRWVTDSLASRIGGCDVDRNGNVIARRSTPGAKGRVLLVAGLDEPGLMVTHVEENGVARVAPIGPLNAKHLVGVRVRFEGGAIGVVDAEHGIDGGAVDFAHLFVAVPAGTVRVGDTAVVDPQFESAGQILYAANLPWRAGAAVLVALAGELAGCPYDVTFLFSAQRSVGARAGRLAVFGETFDRVLDIGTIAAAPAAGKRKGSVRPGGGPVIRALDHSLIVRPEIKDRLIGAARSRGIPYQMGVKPDETSDGGILAMTGGGLPVGGIDIPVYRTRGPMSYLHTSDLEQTLLLLKAALEE